MTLYDRLCFIYITYNSVSKSVQGLCNHPVYCTDIGSLLQTVMSRWTSSGSEITIPRQEMHTLDGFTLQGGPTHSPWAACTSTEWL